MIVLPSRAAMWRIAPFALFMLMLALRAAVAGGDATRALWLWDAGLVGVAVLLARAWPEYGELARQAWPERREVVLAVVVGLALAGLWMRLDEPWMRLGDMVARFRPVDAQGRLIGLQVALHWLGVTFVLPVMAELFWRSFLMRWIEHPRFEGIDPHRVGLRAIVLSTFVFTLAHTLWLAAAISGLAYAVLYVRTGKLWVPVIAHAVSNGVLGVWVIGLGHWTYW